ncbi:hypothetical protein L249_2147 [Ophiocordyceps polyrhachis-furcata BCC 54312]|uniref:Store-operated calcium entry-associated regulatory factor n=1 Tax=Ophiocordyceps polyrhachis-furcata BCC 54312 TaxID=1330021 RepID=A0A367LSM5_9HYPO|nr:hypothetical protein L249_2147 [Ophiocordyceps polyrhachis-furcata BCC 54312]
MLPSHALTSTTLSLLLPLALAARPQNAILLSDVHSLTLRGNGAKTTHRRVPAVPQLQCLSGRLCDIYHLDRMRCQNKGSSYGPQDIEWSCTASLPEELKLGGTDVVCEGYDSTDDPYILKGSCAVEYRLILTSKGEERYPDLARSWSHGYSGDWFSWLFASVFVAICVWILYSACFVNNGRRRPRAAARGHGGGGGGGGGGGWDPNWDPYDPPPPYPGSKSYSARQQAWTPGFWSGFLGGGAAGYMAGSHRRDDSARRAPYPTSWGAGPSTSSSSSDAGPSSLHESYGFGSTRRR